MKKIIGIATLALAGMLAFPVGASARIRVGVAVGGPYWYGPYWGPYWAPYAYAYPNTGEIKVDTKVKDAEIFVNGAFAGTTKDSKTMHLRPGSYNVEIREGGQTLYADNVYVTAGKTLHLHPEL
jgi:PEGA domain